MSPVLLHLRVDDAQSADLELVKNFTASCASALRLLHASLSPLDPEEPREKYESFLDRLEPDVIKHLTVNKLVQFWRTATSVPPSETMLVVPLLDEANAATGTFADRPTKGVSSRVQSVPTQCFLNL